MSRPPFPPFNAETAAQKARMAEDAWNTREEIHKRLEDAHDRLRNSAEQAFRLVAEKWHGREG